MSYLPVLYILEFYNVGWLPGCLSYRPWIWQWMPAAAYTLVSLQAYNVRYTGYTSDLSQQEKRLAK